MIESSNQFSFIKKGSTIRASFRLIKILIEKGPRYSNSFYERERERKNFSLIFLIKKEKYNGSYWIKSIFFFYLHTSPSIIPKEGAKRVAISQGWEEMVVEFPRKLYFPYVRSREATAFLLKKKKKRSFRWKWRLLLRIANAFLVEWGTLGDTVGSLELVDVTNNATGLTNGRARERVSVLNAFSMGW